MMIMYVALVVVVLLGNNTAFRTYRPKIKSRLNQLAATYRVTLIDPS